MDSTFKEYCNGYTNEKCIYHDRCELYDVDSFTCNHMHKKQDKACGRFRLMSYEEIYMATW